MSEFLSDKFSKLTSRNHLVTSASAKVVINQDEKGLGLVAQEPIEFGEVILEEDPYGYTIFKEFRRKFCDSCCKFLRRKSIHFCESCKSVFFCSKQCKESQVHCHICPLVPTETFDDPQEALVFSVITKAVAQRELELCDRNRCIKDEWQSNYKSICRLMSSPFSSNFASSASKLAALVLDIAAKLKMTLALDAKKLAEIIEMHLRQMEVNKVFFKAMSQKLDATSSTISGENDPIGFAIYPTLSLLNHSCKPNVFLLFKGKKAIVRASRNIAPKEEIFFCYGPSIQRDSFKDRQMKLKQYYFFDCECECCINKFESPDIAFKCLTCKGPLIVDECTNSGHCLSCGQTNDDMLDRLERVKWASKLIHIGRIAYEDNDLDDAIEILSKNYNYLDDNLYRTNLVLLEARKFLYECLAVMGHYEFASKLCKLNVNATLDVYGRESVELSIQMISYLSLRCNFAEELAVDDMEKAELEAKELEVLIKSEIEKIERLQAITQDKAWYSEPFEKECETLNLLRERCLWLLESS